MGLRLAFVCAVWVTVITGCTPLNNGKRPPEEPFKTGETVLPRIPPSNQVAQDQANLKSALSLFEQNKSEEAFIYAEKIQLKHLSLNDQAKLNLLYAQINLNRAEAEQALSRLSAIQYALLTPAEQIVYLRAKAFAWSLQGQFVESAKARIALQPLLTITRQQYDNKVATLETLRLLSLPALQAEQAKASDTLAGWIALAGLFVANAQLTINDPNLQQWQTAFAKHPANGAFISTYLNPPQPALTKIALLLPNSGPFAAAAKAIKEGFSAAYKQDGQAVKPQISMYDTAKQEPIALYQQAVAEGAQLIVGPLKKEDIQQLAQVANLTVPVLTLNHLPGLTKTNLYQFALSPIDDAEQITRQAVKDGHKNIIVLTPSTELGQRIQGYFTSALKNAQATLLRVKNYDSDNHDYVAILKDVLNFNETEQRFGQLSRLIPDLHYVPRRRQDVQALFMMAYPQNAHAIKTQLQALGAGNLPIYATSHIYNGVNNPNDMDLDGVVFCDIPWLFNAAYPGALSQESMRPVWQNYPEVYLRLIAMGIDAYNLTPQLAKLSAQGFQGASGNLGITEDSRLQRQLVCAKFNHSQPRLLGFEQNSAPTTPTPPSTTNIAPVGVTRQ